MPNIYDYTDYRKFLKDKVDELRVENPRLSYRNINKRFGLKSSGFVNTIFTGERNLGRVAMGNVCRGLELNEKESMFFELLVHFGQARTAEERDYYLNRLSVCQRTHTQSQSPATDENGHATLTISAPPDVLERVKERLSEFQDSILFSTSPEQ